MIQIPSRSSFVLIVVLAPSLATANATSIEKAARRGDLDDAASQYIRDRESLVPHKKLMERVCIAGRLIATEQEKRAQEMVKEEVLSASSFPQIKWNSYRTQLATAKEVIRRRSELAIVDDCGIDTPISKKIDGLVRGAEQLGQARAAEEFLASSSRLDGGFFDQYPFQVRDRGAMFGRLFAGEFGLFDVRTRFQWVVEYGKDIPANLAKHTVSTYVEQSLPKKLTPETSLKAIEAVVSLLQVLESAMPAYDISEQITLGVYESSGGQYGCTLPKWRGMVNLSEAKNVNELAAKNPSKWTLVVGCLPREFYRAVNANTEISSQYIAGVQQVLNPAYHQAAINVQQMESQVRQAQYNNAVYPGLISAISLGSAQGNLRTAYQVLRQTPQYLEENVFQPYKYRRIDVTYRKNIEIVYILSYRKDTVARVSLVADEAEASEFYGVHAKESDGKTLSSSNEWERRFLEYRGSNGSLDNTDVLASLGKSKISKESAVALLSRDRKETSDIAAGVGAVAAGAVGRAAIPASLPQMQSIVVIVNPDGSHGSGFYVAPQHIVTNAHVVDRVRYVGVRTQRGDKYQAEVVALDAGRDLALLYTEGSRAPLRLGVATATPLGGEVTIIGHPIGLEFSLSRGVVSAVRGMPNLSDPSAELVLTIQTDAAANPGNSGGPLLLGGRVVGIVTYNFRGAEGLNFAVHVQELAEFLKKHSIEYSE